MPYAPLPNPAIGGSIVAILLRNRSRQIALQALKETENGFAPPTAWVGDIPVSAKRQETYSYQADVSEHAVESGARYADHVILHPVKIDVSFAVTNWVRGSAQYTLELLEQMWRSRQPLELMTEHRVLQDMILTNLEADNSLPNWGALSFRATFKQIKLVQLETAKVPAERVAPAENTGGPDTPKSAESPQDEGSVSLLSRTLGGLFD